MLVLSRKPNEEILIGDNIKITVLKVKGNTVRIGIEAPAAVKVKRAELPDARSTSGQPSENSPQSEALELTVSFSPSEEGVSAGKQTQASKQTASKKAAAGNGRADVLSFESAANKARRKPGVTSLSLTPEALAALPAADETDRAQGTNRIKEILNRLVSGLSTDDLGND